MSPMVSVDEVTVIACGTIEMSGRLAFRHVQVKGGSSADCSESAFHCSLIGRLDRQNASFSLWLRCQARRVA